MMKQVIIIKGETRIPIKYYCHNATRNITSGYGLNDLHLLPTEQILAQVSPIINANNWGNDVIIANSNNPKYPNIVIKHLIEVDNWFE